MQQNSKPRDLLMFVTQGNAGEIIDARCCIVITTASGVYIIAQAVFYIEKIICPEKQINIQLPHYLVSPTHSQKESKFT